MRTKMLALTAALLFVSSAASAQDVDPDVGYARGELRAGLGRVGVGALSVAGGVGSLTRGGTFATAFGAPLLAGGGLQLAIGTYDLVGVARWRPGDALRIDRTRMHVVEGVEASLVVAGGLTAYFGSASDGARGFGLGLALESGLALLADVFEERRADRYAEGLRRIRVGSVPGGAWIGVSLF